MNDTVASNPNAPEILPPEPPAHPGFNNSNPLPALAQNRGVVAKTSAAGTEMTRAAEEVRVAMFAAKQFPRDELTAYNRIMQACRRKGVAESAEYAFPRGGTMVKGPSIRLAETIKQAWGNIMTGFIELSADYDAGVSEVMVYAHDLETNTKESSTFHVRHFRYTKDGSLTRLRDPRDIFEMIANQAARRVRSCIFKLIPDDVVDAAVDECHKTLLGDNKEPLVDRVRKMVMAFADFGVTAEMIEKKLGHNLNATIPTELLTLQKFYVSLRDGMATVDQIFGAPKLEEPAAGGAAAPAEKGKAKRQTKAEKEAAAAAAQQAGQSQPPASPPAAPAAPASPATPAAPAPTAPPPQPQPQPATVAAAGEAVTEPDFVRKAREAQAAQAQAPAASQQQASDLAFGE